MKTPATVLALILLTSASAVAQDKDQLARSDQHYQEGSRLYHAGDYAAAVLELKEGYELAPHPIFLVNIALAYAKLENWPEAAIWGRRAATEPGLQADTNSQTAARAEAWNLLATSHAVAVNVSAAAEAQVEAQAETVVQPPPPKKRGPRTLGWIGIGAGGAGLLAAGGAGVIGALLQDDRRAFETAAATGDAEDYELYKGRIDSGQSIGRVLLFSGVGLVAVGGALLLIDRLTVETQVAVSPNGPAARVIVRW